VVVQKKGTMSLGWHTKATLQKANQAKGKATLQKANQAKGKATLQKANQAKGKATLQKKQSNSAKKREIVLYTCSDTLKKPTNTQSIDCLKDVFQGGARCDFEGV